MKKKFLGVICCIVFCTALSQVNVYGAGSPRDFATHYEAGQQALLDNQYSTAIVEFRKALRINYMDSSARIGVVNSYLARAAYYVNQEKNYEKGANDFRSALFYLKMFPDTEQEVQNSIGMISSASASLNQCLKVLSTDTTPSARYKKAEELKGMGNFPASAYEFSQAAQNDKLSADSYTQIADLMKILGYDNRSAYYFKKALDLRPNDGSLRMKYARTLDKLGQYDSAVNEYNEALSNSKGDMEVLYALERIYLKKLAMTPKDAELNANLGAIKQAQGDFDSAMVYYGKAEQINPNSITARLNVGTLYQQKKDYNRAMQAYNSVLTLHPDNTKAMLYKAQALTEMGDTQAAMALYRTIVTLEPKNKEANDALAALIKSSMTPNEYIVYLNQHDSMEMLYDYAYKLHKENKITDAIMGYRAYIAKIQTNPDAYVNLAICYASKDDYGAAVTTLNVAKSKFPTNENVLKTLKDVQSDYNSTKVASAALSYESKEYKKAIKEYLEITPATEDTMLGVASCYQALEDYDNAVAYYKKAQELNPKNAEIPYYIGYLYSERKDWNNARLYLEKAIKMNPQSQAKSLLSYVNQNVSLGVLNQGIDLFEKKNYQEAISKFNEVIKKEATNAYAYYYRGLIYDEQKNVELAIKDYLNVLKNSEEFPIVNYMLAVDYDGLSNYKDAYKYYKLFTAKYKTDDEYFKYAQSRMKELEPYAG